MALTFVLGASVYMIRKALKIRMRNDKTVHINEQLMSLLFLVVCVQNCCYAILCTGFILDVLPSTTIETATLYKMNLATFVMLAVIQLMLIYLFWVFGATENQVTITKTGRITLTESDQETRRQTTKLIAELNASDDDVTSSPRGNGDSSVSFFNQLMPERDNSFSLTIKDVDDVEQPQDIQQVSLDHTMFYKFLRQSRDNTTNESKVDLSGHDTTQAHLSH